MAVSPEIRQIGKNIRKLREMRGITREKFCQALYYDVVYWGSIERGERGINVQKLIEVSRYFNVSIDSLVGMPVEATKANDRQIEEINLELKDCSANQVARLKRIIEDIIPYIK